MSEELRKELAGLKAELIAITEKGEEIQKEREEKEAEERKQREEARKEAIFRELMGRCRDAADRVERKDIFRLEEIQQELGIVVKSEDLYEFEKITNMNIEPLVGGEYKICWKADPR